METVLILVDKGIDGRAAGNPKWVTSHKSNWTSTNIPAENTSFVGRRRQVSDAVRLLRRERLLTVVGAPGIGKTRLALRVATQVGARFRDGVWLVELAPLPDIELVPQSVVDVLRVHRRPGQPVLDTLREYLADKELLLVIDSCHHVLDASVGLVSSLLTGTPGLRVLATSRQVLRVTGERVLDVPPLVAPDPDSPITAAASRYEAVRLFADRARLACPGFVVNKGNRTAVGRICVRLDGVPLAIELAAMRVRALSPAQMVEGLSDYLDFLLGGSQVAMPRLEPLSAAIDRSYDLCSTSQQVMWQYLSELRGNFDLEAVEKVCASVRLPPAEALNLVTDLIEKSILIRSDRAGAVGYRMLEPIRQYGLAKLRESGKEMLAR